MRFKAVILQPGAKKPDQIFASDKASIRSTINMYPEGSKVKLYEQQDVLIESYVRSDDEEGGVQP